MMSSRCSPSSSSSSSSSDSKKTSPRPTENEYSNDERKSPSLPSPLPSPSSVLFPPLPLLPLPLSPSSLPSSLVLDSPFSSPRSKSVPVGNFRCCPDDNLLPLVDSTDLYRLCEE